MAAEISVEEWLSELARVEAEKRAEPAGLSTEQIAAIVGCGSHRARDLVRGWLASGQMRTVSRKTVNLAGRLTTTVAYLPLKPIKGKKRAA